MNARADIDLVLPCYNPPSGWEERVATHFREVERLFSPVRFHLFIVSDGSRRGYEPETIDRLLSGKCYPNCPTYAIHGSCGSRSRIRKGA